MSKKCQLLIVHDGDKLPGALSLAVEQLGLDSQICRASEALGELSGEGTEAAVLVLEEMNQLEEDSFKELTKQAQALSVDMLVLVEEATGKDQRKGRQKGLFITDKNESSEMLKGRLAMLLEMRPWLTELTVELERLRSVSTPMSNYFTQVDEEMRLAARLQRDFLPKQLPKIHGIRFADVYRPATWVSGDIYDVVRLDETHIGLYVADVVGHGMPAALLTMFIKRAIVTKQISGHSYTLIEPSKVLERLNTAIVEQKLSDFQFVTCCYGLFNTQTLELQIANAGHPLPLLIDEQGQLRELDVKGSLLGIFENQTFSTKTFQLVPGEKLLLYSDGVEVAFVDNEPGQPLRFRQEFEHVAMADVRSMCDTLMEVIEKEEGSLHPRDDVTIVGMELLADG